MRGEWRMGVWTLAMVVLATGVVAGESGKKKKVKEKDDDPVVLVRAIDAMGGLAYVMVPNGAAVDEEKKRHADEYDKKKSAWDKEKDSFLKSRPDGKFEKVEPLSPIVEVVAPESPRKSAKQRQAELEMTDWIVYKILGRKAQYFMFPKGADRRLAQAAAEAEHAAVYNEWLKAGKKDPEPKAPPALADDDEEQPADPNVEAPIQKLAEGLSKASATKKLQEYKAAAKAGK